MTQYDFNFRTSLPSTVHRKVLEALSTTSAIMKGSRIAGVHASIAMLRKPWTRQYASFELLIIADFKSPYRVIKDMSSLLALAYVETNILPIIHPCETRRWLREIEADAKMARSLRECGVIIHINRAH